MVDCHVYDTLGQHELDFEALSYIGFMKNLRISYCSYYQQLDCSSYGLLLVAIATDLMHGLNPEIARYNVVRTQIQIRALNKKFKEN